MDNPELPYLPTFAKAAELGSFTAAGKTLGMTQAAISQRMHALEGAIGKPLFHRRGGHVFLTEAGRKLYEFAQKIAELHRAARRDIAGKEAPPKGDLYLAASSVPGEHLLPGLLSAFARRYPHVRAHAAVSDSLAVLKQVERGEVSLGLVGRRTDNAHLEFRRLCSDRMVLAVSPRHPLARRKEVPAQQLTRYPMVIREAGSGLRHGFEKALTDAGLAVADLDIALELGSNEAIKEAVRRSVGVAVLSIHALEKELKSRQLCAVELRGLETRRDIFLVHDRRRILPLPARLFLDFLDTHPMPSPRP